MQAALPKDDIRNVRESLVDNICKSNMNHSNC